MNSRLWIIQRSYTPRQGGASRRIQELSWAMKNNYNWNVSVLSCRTNEFPTSVLHDGVQVEIASPHPLSVTGRWFFIWNTIKLLYAHRFEVQVVHVNAPFLEAGMLVRFCRRRGIRIILQLTLEGQDDPFSLSQGRKYPPLLIRLLMGELGKADAILCMSPTLQSLCQRYGWEGKRLSWSPHAKDIDLFRPARDADEVCIIRQEFGLPSDRILVGFLGGLQSRKGFSELLEAWSQTNTGQVGWLVFAGAILPDQQVWVEAQLSLHGPSITYLGLLNRPQVARFLRCLDLFALPSKAEGMSGALVEAILSGVPCLTSDLSGVNDLLVQDGVTGILVPPDNTQALAVALHRFLSSGDFRASLSSNRAVLAQLFDHRRVYAAYDHIYSTGELGFESSNKSILK